MDHGQEDWAPTIQLSANYASCRERDDPVDRHIVEDYQKRSKQESKLKKEQRPEGEASRHESEKQQDYDRTAEQEGLESALMSMCRTSMDVAEVYSPPRVTSMAQQCGFNAGWSLDLTTTDENGRAWDFDCVHMRNKAARKLLTDKPKLLIGSPQTSALGCM